MPSYATLVYRMEIGREDPPISMRYITRIMWQSFLRICFLLLSTSLVVVTCVGMGNVCWYVQGGSDDKRFWEI